MTRSTTPPPPPPTATTTSTQSTNGVAQRQPPSLPNSPLAKRPKTATSGLPLATETNNTNHTSNSHADTTGLGMSTSAPAPAPAPAPPPATAPLLIKKLTPTATTPTRGSAFSAGYDLSAAVATTIPAHGKALVSTGLAMAVPAGTYGRVAPRSGLAAKHFIDTGAGVIDADYRGEVKVLLFNHGAADFAVAPGDRVAQLVLEVIRTPDVVDVADAELEASARGAGGFGSTGVAAK